MNTRLRLSVFAATCAACIGVTVGAFKAMQVAAGVALPKDVTLKINAE